jgi:hypothetical protein
LHRQRDATEAVNQVGIGDLDILEQDVRGLALSGRGPHSYDGTCLANVGFPTVGQARILDSDLALELAPYMLRGKRPAIMVTLFAAALVWQGTCAKALLDSARVRYRGAGRFSCRLNYDCTKTLMGPEGGPGVKDFMDLSMTRTGGSYRVSPIGGSFRGEFRATRSNIGMDPYLVYDHHLTYWLGFRKTALSLRLVADDASGPFFSLFVVGPRKVAVYETYMSPKLPPFELTYAVDPVDLRLLSVSTCGVVGSANKGATGAILWTESVELTHQSFGM